jgi:Peptidase A4 family
MAVPAGLWIALLVASVSFAMTGPMVDSVASGTLEPIVHGPLFVANATSSNWGGYAVSTANGAVSMVEGSWIEPAVNGSCPSANEYAAFWVGIDGYSSSTVEQTGTDTDCSGGAPQYYAWYEFYPAGSVTISSLTLHAGDVISAKVSYASGKFTIKITDVTAGGTFTKSQAVSGAKRSSAEWITERPSICATTCSLAKLTNFGVVDFGKDYTGVGPTDRADISGHTKPIGSLSNIVSIAISASGKNYALAGALTPDQTSFVVQWV